MNCAKLGYLRPWAAAGSAGRPFYKALWPWWGVVGLIWVILYIVLW